MIPTITRWSKKDNGWRKKNTLKNKFSPRESPKIRFISTEMPSKKKTNKETKRPPKVTDGMFIPMMPTMEPMIKDVKR